MKKLLSIVLVAISVFGLSQYSYSQVLVNRTNGNFTVEDVNLFTNRSFKLPVFTDTTAANNSVPTLDSAGKLIFTYDVNSVWLRQSAPLRWTLWGGGGGGTSTQDTVYVADDLYVVIDSLGHQVIHRLHNDGLVSGGIVTWSGSGLKFYISPAVYYINQTRYETGLDSVTLDPSDPTNPRIDAFVVDTIPDTDFITGTASGSPVTPQHDPPSQLTLATILLNAGDTIPTSVVGEMIYNENIEWTHTIAGTQSTNFDDLSNPYVGVKDIYMATYASGSSITFTKPGVETIDLGKTLNIAFYSNGTFKNKILLYFFSGGTKVSTTLTVTSAHGLNTNDSNRYQIISIPLSAWTWSSGTATFTALKMQMVGSDISGAKGFYLDKIQLQSGVTNIPPANDFSNKVDSVTRKVGTDPLFYWVKGVPKFFSTVGSSGGGNTNTNLGAGYRLAVPNTNNIKTLFAGTNITMDSTTNANGITINASGGGASVTGLYQKLTATGGQTVFTFTLIPTDTEKVGFYRNGMLVPQSFYSIAGNQLTFTSGLDNNDTVEEQGVE